MFKSKNLYPKNYCGMKKFLFITVILLSFQGKAQMWCPPGATWHHRAINGYPPVNGYYYYTYLNDTIINSKSYNRIKESFRGTNPMWGLGVIDKPLGIKYTRQQNNVIYLFEDTLYNFNAIIGDKWLKAKLRSDGINYAPVCNGPRRIVEVIDTGHLIINSVNLKTLTLKYQFKWVETNTLTTIQTYTDVVCQKLGSLTKGFTPETCETMSGVGPTMHDTSFTGLVCYKDNNFGLYESPAFTNACNNIYVLGYSKETQDLSFFIFPNPTNSNLMVVNTLTTEKSNLEIIITDALGKKVYHGFVTNNGNLQVPFNNLNAGLYFLSAYIKNELVQSNKIIKIE
jgi:hypothetical protein